MPFGFFVVIWSIAMLCLVPLTIYVIYDRNFVASIVLGSFLLLLSALGPSTKKYAEPCRMTAGTNSLLLECGDKSRVLTEVPVGFSDSSKVEIRGWYSLAGFKTQGDVYINGNIHY